MTNTENTTASVLAHHGIDVVGKTDESIVDDARAAGLIYACLGCGSVGGIDPDAPLGDYPNVEAARAATKGAILAVDDEAFDCCPDADTILF